MLNPKLGPSGDVGQNRFRVLVRLDEDAVVVALFGGS